eukprot:COSAG04_NODE_475_length_13749_cov_11.148498_1_plen_1383_part_10
MYLAGDAVACASAAQLEAAQVEPREGDGPHVDAASPLDPGCSAALGPGQRPFMLALSPSEDKVAVCCDGSPTILLFGLPGLQPLEASLDAGGPVRSCAWTDDEHVLALPAPDGGSAPHVCLAPRAPASANLLSLDGAVVATSACDEATAVCVGWLSDAADAEPTVFVASADAVEECGADLQPRRTVPDVGEHGFRISQLQLLDSKTLFVAFTPEPETDATPSDEELRCKFVDLSGQDTAQMIEEGWTGDRLYEKLDDDDPASALLVNHRVSYFVAPFRDTDSTNAMIVTSCAGTIALMQPDSGDWEPWDADEATGNDIPFPTNEQTEYDRVIGAVARVSADGGGGAGMFCTGEGRLLIFPVSPDGANRLVAPVLRSGGAGSAPAVPLPPSTPPKQDPPVPTFSTPAPPADPPAAPASTGGAFGGFGAASGSTSLATTFSFSKPATSAPAAAAATVASTSTFGSSGGFGASKSAGFGGFGAASSGGFGAASSGGFGGFGAAASSGAFGKPATQPAPPASPASTSGGAFGAAFKAAPSAAPSTFSFSQPGTDAPASSTPSSSSSSSSTAFSFEKPDAATGFGTFGASASSASKPASGFGFGKADAKPAESKGPKEEDAKALSAAAQAALARAGDSDNTQATLPGVAGMMDDGQPRLRGIITASELTKTTTAPGALSSTDSKPSAFGFGTPSASASESAGAVQQKPSGAFTLKAPDKPFSSEPASGLAFGPAPAPGPATADVDDAPDAPDTAPAPAPAPAFAAALSKTTTAPPSTFSFPADALPTTPNAAPPAPAPQAPAVIQKTSTAPALSIKPASAVPAQPPQPAQAVNDGDGRLGLELAKADSALGSLVIDFFLLEGVENGENYRASLKQAGRNDFHSARDFMRAKYGVEWSTIYTFFQEACMAYFSKEYRDAKLPPGPSQPQTPPWSNASFEKFCAAQVRAYGVDPVRLFLLKDIRPRQDTYRLAATLRRCELDVASCHSENAAVEKASASALAELRAAVLSAGGGAGGTPPFCELWDRSTALQDGSKTVREKVLQACFAEKRKGASAGVGASDASGEYQSALTDLTALANRLSVTDSVASDRPAFADDAADTAAIGPEVCSSGKSDAEAKMEATLKRLRTLREDLEDANLKARLVKASKLSTSRELNDTVQIMSARARRNKEALEELEELKGEVVRARKEAGMEATALDELDSAVALLGIHDDSETAKIAAMSAQQKRQSQLDAKLAAAKVGRAELYAKKTLEVAAKGPKRSSKAALDSRDNFTRIIPPKLMLTESTKQPQPEPEPEPEPSVGTFAPSPLARIALPPAPAAAAAPAVSLRKPIAGLSSVGPMGASDAVKLLGKNKPAGKPPALSVSVESSQDDAKGKSEAEPAAPLAFNLS